MQKINTIRTKFLMIVFKNKLNNHLTSAFRGGINEKVGRKHDLFHNHNFDGTSIYRYPLIQFKISNNQPTILCLREGTTAINELIKQKDWKIDIKGEPIELVIDSIDFKEVTIKVSSELQTYFMPNWLGLNQDNATIYKTFKNYLEQKRFLEKLLVGNILSCLKGLGIHECKEILVEIHHFRKKYTKVKGVQFAMFECRFTTNVTLPYGLGIGKHVSRGFGTLQESKQKIN